MMFAGYVPFRRNMLDRDPCYKIGIFNKLFVAPFLFSMFLALQIRVSTTNVPEINERAVYGTIFCISG